MARLVALRLSLADGLLDALDRTWADGDAALVLDPNIAPALADRMLESFAPDATIDVDGTASRPDAPGIADGTALVMTTSGSTGAPKGVVLPWSTLHSSVAASRTRLGAADGVAWLGVLPLHHVAGIGVLLRSRAAGREPRMHDRDTPEIVDAAEPSWISLVPLQLQRLLDANVDLARHVGVLLGGAAASPALLARARTAAVHVVTSYGSSESCGGCVYDGRPLHNVQVRVQPSGRLAIRGPVIAAGLRQRNGEMTPLAVDGWLTTGDLGEVAADGTVRVLGRADDIVISGGENVPLAPVRAAVASLPDVAACAVVGLPDARWGTAVVAVVVPRDAGAPPTLAAVRAATRGMLPAAHRPTRLVVVGTLPVDGLGKVTPRTVAPFAASPRTT